MKSLDLKVENGLIRAETRRWNYVFNKQALFLRIYIVIFEYTRQQNESHKTVKVAETPKANYSY
jgi:hypothetical protein